MMIDDSWVSQFIRCDRYLSSNGSSCDRILDLRRGNIRGVSANVTNREGSERCHDEKKFEFDSAREDDMDDDDALRSVGRYLRDAEQEQRYICTFR